MLFILVRVYTIVMTDMTKFLIIAGCFAVSVLALGRAADKRDSRLVCAALGFTVAADYFLLIKLNYELGLAAFIIVQIVYNIRYRGIKVKHALVLSAGLFALANVMAGLSVLYALALVYAVLFCFSLSAAVRCFYDGSYPFINGYLVLGGMVCYAVCDVFVALLNSGTAFALQQQRGIVFVIWLFYIPGMMALSISGIDFLSKRNTNFMESS